MALGVLDVLLAEAANRNLNIELQRRTKNFGQFATWMAHVWPWDDRTRTAVGYSHISPAEALAHALSNFNVGVHPQRKRSSKAVAS